MAIILTITLIVFLIILSYFISKSIRPPLLFKLLHFYLLFAVNTFMDLCLFGILKKIPLESEPL